MSQQMLLAGYIALVILVLGGYAALAYLLAQKKMFFTMPKEGTAEFAMVGKKVSRMIVAWRGHTSDGEFNIVERRASVSLHFINPLNWLEPWGIYWVGIWPFYSIYRYPFVWTEEKIDDRGDIVPYTRRAVAGDQTEGGPTPLIKINDTNYFVSVNDVKTKSKVPLKWILLVTVRIVNPYKALFGGSDWLKRTDGAIGNKTVRYTSALSYEEVIAGKAVQLPVVNKQSNKIEKTVLATIEGHIKMLGDQEANDEDGTDLVTKYGVLIVAAKIHVVDFADEDARKQYAASTTQIYVAHQAGLAEEALAKGQAKAVGIRARAEADRIETVYGPIAGDNKAERMKIRQVEGYEHAGEKGNATVVVPSEVFGLAAGITSMTKGKKGTP